MTWRDKRRGILSRRSLGKIRTGHSSAAWGCNGALFPQTQNGLGSTALNSEKSSLVPFFSSPQSSAQCLKGSIASASCPLPALPLRPVRPCLSPPIDTFALQSVLAQLRRPVRRPMESHLTGRKPGRQRRELPTPSVSSLCKSFSQKGTTSMWGRRLPHKSCLK